MFKTSEIILKDTNEKLMEIEKETIINIKKKYSLILHFINKILRHTSLESHNNSNSKITKSMNSATTKSMNSTTTKSLNPTTIKPMNSTIKPMNPTTPTNYIYRLTDFNKVQHETLVKNEENNKRLLKKYFPTLNKSLALGITNIINQDTANESIKKDYIIKFIKLCVESIGYTLEKKIIDKTKNNIHYTIKVGENQIAKI